MPDLFKDFVKSIQETKYNHMETPEDEKDYVPFVVNRALSFHMDTVLLANEMNLLPHLSKSAQYGFLLNTVVAKKRPWAPWIKYESPADLDIVKEYYSCSSSKAKDYLALLTSDQLDEIKRLLDKGGMTNDRPKRIGLGKVQRTRRLSKD